MQPEGSLRCSHEPSTGPYPELVQSSSHPSYLRSLKCILIFCYLPRLGHPVGLFPWGIVTKNFNVFFQWELSNICTENPAILGILDIVTCFSDYRRGLGLETGFIDHLQVVTTRSHNTLANSRTPQFTTAHTESFQSAVASRFPVTDLKNGDSSASILNCTE
jgi:hypothetical protein